MLELYWPFEADDVTSFVVAFVVNQEEGEMLELSHYENCSAGDDNSLVVDLARIGGKIGPAAGSSDSGPRATHEL